MNPYELETAIKAGVEGVEECAIVGVSSAFYNIDLKPYWYQIEMCGNTLPHAFIVGNPVVNDVLVFVRGTLLLLSAHLLITKNILLLLRKPLQACLTLCCIIDYFPENFVSYKHLAGVSLVTELPKTATGKLKRVDLVQVLYLPDSLLSVFEDSLGTVIERIDSLSCCSAFFISLTDYSSRETDRDYPHDWVEFVS